jgi:hypothetical protein
MGKYSLNDPLFFIHLSNTSISFRARPCAAARCSTRERPEISENSVHIMGVGGASGATLGSAEGGRYSELVGTRDTTGQASSRPLSKRLSHALCSRPRPSSAHSIQSDGSSKIRFED